MFGRNEEDLKRDYLIIAGEDPSVVAEVQATPLEAEEVILAEIDNNLRIARYNRFQIFELVEYIIRNETRDPVLTDDVWNTDVAYDYAPV